MSQKSLTSKNWKSPTFFPICPINITGKALNAFGFHIHLNRRTGAKLIIFSVKYEIPLALNYKWQTFINKKSMEDFLWRLKLGTWIIHNMTGFRNSLSQFRMFLHLNGFLRFFTCQHLFPQSWRNNELSYYC